MARRASRIYLSDISYGEITIRRGHWSDRLPFIQQELVTLEQYYAVERPQTASASAALERVTITSARPSLFVKHEPPTSFHPGEDLTLSLVVSPQVASITLWYRHVNQGERWLSEPMQQSAGTHSATIPGSYTNSPYPLQYYFELRTAEAATLHPFLNATLSNQPYFALMPATT